MVNFSTEFILGAGIGTLLIFMILFFRSWFKVEEGHMAVLTRFGKAIFENEEKRQLKKYPPGIHLKMPWDQAIQFSTMERFLDLSGDEGRYAMAADGTVLKLDSKVRFSPLKENLYAYLFELKNPMEHIKEMFTCLLRSEIANFSSEDAEKFDFMGSYSQIRRDRTRLNHDLKKFCQDKIGENYGIRFNGVDLIDILPPHELETSLNAIQNAQTDAETIYARAEADARQRIASAQQGVEIARLRADAVAIEIQTQSVAIKKLIEQGQFQNYLRHRKAEIFGDSKLTLIQKEN